MLTRSLFLQLAAAFAASPSPQPTAIPWDMCMENPALPYDKPLEIKMRVLDGPDFDLMKYRGNPTLLHIFATWCEPCAVEMPHIVAAARKYSAQGLRVVGIDFAESDDSVRTYRKKYAIPFPIAMDERGGFTNALESGRSASNIEFPVSLYISAAGYLYCYTQGTTENPAAELTYRIEKFIKDAS